jgi:histidinol dehydrogenase
MEMRRLDTSDANFAAQLEQLGASQEELNPKVDKVVADIVADVRARGDAAVIDYTAEFDRLTVSSVAQLKISKTRLKEALEAIDPLQRDALESAAERVRSYHERQKQDSWQYRDDGGNLLGQKITAMQRVGIYVPGGKASYPSSVLMNALPAKVAGVGEIIMVVPAPDGELSDLVLAAAEIAGVDQVFTVGGAQAVAALAYGTETIPAVDKIVGPGNVYVATAKRQVFGKVGIDMIAGPSEILIICDGGTDPDWIAMDLFAQCEHDENSQAILLCPNSTYLDAVQACMDRLLPEMEREEIIRVSLKNRGALIKTRDLNDALAISNQLAPEHLELSVADPEALLPDVQHAGAIFMGPYTAEALGIIALGPITSYLPRVPPGSRHRLGYMTSRHVARLLCAARRA